MIDVFTVIDEIAKSLPSSPTRYKLTQPTTNLPDEFTVINSLALQGRQVQNGVFNVNIHVKNLASPDGSQPNVKRMQEIAKEYMTALNQIWINNKLITIDDAGKTFREDNGYHYLNIRVGYSFYNLKN